MRGRAFGLGLGGNLGDVARALEGAVADLSSDRRVSSPCVSSLYETPPWGMVLGGSFLNCAVCGGWTGTDRGLLELCRQLEADAGSPVEKNGGERYLDVDILFLQGCVSTPELTVPHPRMSQRRFVLVPLAEIWRAEVPGTGMTPGDMLLRVEDPASIIFRGGLQKD